MIILTCPNCESTKLEREESIIEATGQDWFYCKECEARFELEKSSYRSERDIFS